MSRDLTIRLLGRPQVTVDGASGLQKLTRKYVVQGPRATFTGITDNTNPLFLALGSMDEEFETYLLINQTLAPSDGSMDKAYLTREYLEFNNKWSSESVSDAGPFKQVSRKYAVLKAEHAKGYGATEWSKHPANSVSDNDPWDYLPESIKSSEPTASSYGAGFTWTRKSASIVTSEAGLDVWQVSWFEPIRPTGRPAYSIDPRTKLDSITRQYHITQALADDLDSTVYESTFAIGTEDSENSGFYLVDLQVKPSNQTEISLLTARYTKVNNDALTEAFQQTNDLIRVRKRFAVLRNDHETLGYGAASWDKHPSQATTYAQDPWEYAPSWVANATPGSRNYTVTNADDANEHGFDESPQIEGQDLGTYISSHASTGDWLKGYAVMSQAGSGLDIWTVEWVTHAPPYWQLGTGSGKRSRTSSARVVELNSKGLNYLYSVASSGQVSYQTRSMSYTFFVKGSKIPSELAIIGGGSASVSFSPAVKFDITLIDSENKVTFIKEHLSNVVWGGDTSSLNLPVNGGDGSTVDVVSNSPGNSLEIDWEAQRSGDDMTHETEEGGTDFVLAPDGSILKKYLESDYLVFNGLKIKRISGTVSWTITESSYSWSSSSGTFGQTRTQITPIFSHGSEKIWKVAITYVGG